MRLWSRWTGPTPTPSDLPRSQHDHFLGRRREHLATVIGYHDRILDSHAATARQVNAWFDGNHHAWPQEFLLPGGYARGFVNLKSYPVARRMCKVAGQSRPTKHLA